jgi:hypothetical protein
VPTGRKLFTLQGHTQAVTSAVFRADGQYVLTGSGDGLAALWDAGSGRELARLVSLKGTADWLVISREGLFDGSRDGRQKVGYRLGPARDGVALDRFFEGFYRPGLLSVLLGGDRPLPRVVLAGRPAPRVVIVSPPRQGGVVEKAQLTLEVEAVDQGGGITGPHLVHNGARIVASGKAEQDGLTVRRRFVVALVQGANVLEVQAANGDGSWESEPATLTVRYEKPLEKAILYLVAVGISQYTEGSFQLKFARTDAEAFIDLFRRRGPALYAEVQVTPLLDADATRANIHKAVQEAAGKARPQDTLLLFVAGHGALAGQRYYVIPHEFRTRPGKTLDQDISEQGVPAEVLAEFLSSGAALKRLLILDTCASGGVVGLFRVGSRNPFGLRGQVERLSRSQGIHIVAAAAATEEAKEPGPLGHGVLSYALLAGLKGVSQGPLQRQWVQASGPEQVVEVLEWFGFAASQVPRLTREFCGQEQNVHTAGKGGSFPVLPLQAP